MIVITDCYYFQISIEHREIFTSGTTEPSWLRYLHIMIQLELIFFWLGRVNFQRIQFLTHFLVWVEIDKPLLSIHGRTNPFHVDNFLNQVIYKLPYKEVRTMDGHWS